jgi:hypothetical protein
MGTYNPRDENKIEGKATLDASESLIEI